MPFSWHSFIARLRLRAQPRSSPRVINRMRAEFDPAFDEAANKPASPIALLCRKFLRFMFMFTDRRVEKLHRAESVPRAVVQTLASRLAIRMIASKLRSTSSSVVAHEETLMRIAARPCQIVPPHQQVPSA